MRVDIRLLWKAVVVITTTRCRKLLRVDIFFATRCSEAGRSLVVVYDA